MCVSVFLPLCVCDVCVLCVICVCVCVSLPLCVCVCVSLPLCVCVCVSLPLCVCVCLRGGIGSQSALLTYIVSFNYSKDIFQPSFQSR